MKKRLTILVPVLLGTAFAAALTLWFLFPGEPRFTEKQGLMVRKCMTEDEVAAVLGCPPGDYTNGHGIYDSLSPELNSVEELLGFYPKSWCNSEWAISIEVGDDGGISEVRFGRNYYSAPTLTERIKGWLSLGK